MPSLGEAFVELGIRDQNLINGLNNAEKRMEAYNRTIQRVARRTQIATAALSAAITVLTRRSAKYADEIVGVAKSTGLAVESVQALGYAAEQSNSDLVTLQTGLRSFVRRAAEAHRGNQQFAKGFEQIGVAVSNVAGEMRGTEELLLEVAEAISGMNSEAEASAVMMRLMGDAGRRLVPFMRQGAVSIEGLMQKARELGIVTSETAIRGLAQFNDETNTMRARMAAVGREIAVQFVGPLTVLNRWLGVGIDYLQDMDTETRNTLTRWVMFGGALLVGVSVLGLVATAALLAVKGIALLGSVIGIVSSPIVLTLAAVAAGAYALHKAWESDWLGIKSFMEDTVTPAILTGLNNMVTNLDAVAAGARGVIDALDAWADRTITWFVNLDAGEVAQEVLDWIGDRVEWFVDLGRGAVVAAKDWLVQTREWAVDLGQGALVATQAWLVQTREWAVDLGQGAIVATKAWLVQTREWTVDLAQGAVVAAQEWLVQTREWAINLGQGALVVAKAWLVQTTEWAINLGQGALVAAQAWLVQVREWAIDLGVGSIVAASDWLVQTTEWAIDLGRGALIAASEWLVQTREWAINLGQGALIATRDWLVQTREWAINLGQGAIVATQAWLVQAREWAINLGQGALVATREWLVQTREWAVDLGQGAVVAAKAWLEQRTEWWIDLTQGHIEAAREWLSQRTEWLIDLFKGSEIAVSPWIGRVISWFVELLPRVNLGESQLLQSLVGQNLSAEEVAEIRLSMHLAGYSTEEIEREIATRQMPEWLQNLQAKIDSLDPMTLNMGLEMAVQAASFTLAITAASLFTKAGTALIALGGWLAKAVLAGGSLSLILPIAGVVLAVALISWDFESGITAEGLLDGFRSRMAGILAAGIITIGGAALGAGALPITIAAMVTFAAFEIDWSFVGAKMADLWDRLSAWGAEKFPGLFGDRGVIRMGVQLVFDIQDLLTRGAAEEVSTTSGNAKVDAIAGGGVEEPLAILDDVAQEIEALTQEVKELGEAAEKTGHTVTGLHLRGRLGEYAGKAVGLFEGVWGRGAQQDPLTHIESVMGHPGIAEFLAAVSVAEGVAKGESNWQAVMQSFAGNANEDYPHGRFDNALNQRIFEELLPQSGFKEGSEEYFALAAGVSALHYWRTFQTAFEGYAGIAIGEMTGDAKRLFVDHMARGFAPPTGESLRPAELEKNPNWPGNVLSAWGSWSAGTPWTGSGSTNDVAGVVHNQEAVIPAGVLREGPAEVLDFLGAPGFFLGRLAGVFSGGTAKAAEIEEEVEKVAAVVEVEVTYEDMTQGMSSEPVPLNELPGYEEWAGNRQNELEPFMDLKQLAEFRGLAFEAHLAVDDLAESAEQATKEIKGIMDGLDRAKELPSLFRELNLGTNMLGRAGESLGETWGQYQAGEISGVDAAIAAFNTEMAIPLGVYGLRLIPGMQKWIWLFNLSAISILVAPDVIYKAVTDWWHSTKLEIEKALVALPEDADAFDISFAIGQVIGEEITDAIFNALPAVSTFYDYGIEIGAGIVGGMLVGIFGVAIPRAAKAAWNAWAELLPFEIGRHALGIEPYRPDYDAYRRSLQDIPTEYSAPHRATPGYWLDIPDPLKWLIDLLGAIPDHKSGTPWTGSGPVDKVAGVVHNREAVIPWDALRDGVPGVLEFLGAPGFQSGWIPPAEQSSLQFQSEDWAIPAFAAMAGPDRFAEAMRQLAAEMQAKGITPETAVKSLQSALSATHQVAAHTSRSVPWIEPLLRQVQMLKGFVRPTNEALNLTQNWGAYRGWIGPAGQFLRVGPELFHKHSLPPGVNNFGLSGIRDALASGWVRIGPPPLSLFSSGDPTAMDGSGMAINKASHVKLTAEQNRQIMMMARSWLKAGGTLMTEGFHKDVHVESPAGIGILQGALQGTRGSITAMFRSLGLLMAPLRWLEDVINPQSLAGSPVGFRSGTPWTGSGPLDEVAGVVHNREAVLPWDVLRGGPESVLRFLSVPGFSEGKPWTGSGPLDEVAGVVHNQEAVIPWDALRNGVPGVLEFLGAPGFQAGWIPPGLVDLTNMASWAPEFWGAFRGFVSPAGELFNIGAEAMHYQTPPPGFGTGTDALNKIAEQGWIRIGPHPLSAQLELFERTKNSIMGIKSGRTIPTMAIDQLKYGNPATAAQKSTIMKMSRAWLESGGQITAERFGPIGRGETEFTGLEKLAVLRATLGGGAQSITAMFRSLGLLMAPLRWLEEVINPQSLAGSPVGFRSGTPWTGSGNPNDIAGVVHNREAVLPWDVLRGGPESVLRFLSVPGFSEGKPPSIPLASGATGGSTFDWLRDQTMSAVEGVLGEEILDTVRGYLDTMSKMYTELMDSIGKLGDAVEDLRTDAELLKQELEQSVSRAAMVFSTGLQALASGLREAGTLMGDVAGNFLDTIQITVDKSLKMVVDWEATMHQATMQLASIIGSALATIFTGGSAARYRGMDSRGEDRFPDLTKMMDAVDNWDDNLARLAEVNRKIAASTIGGAAGGAAIGSLFGPIGIAIGGLLGGLFGRGASTQHYEQEMQDLEESLNITRQSIREMLGIAMQDIASGLRQAFGSSAYDGFIEDFTAQLGRQTENALITAFMTGEAMRPILEAISDALDDLILGGAAGYEAIHDLIADAGQQFEVLLPVLEDLRDEFGHMKDAASAVNGQLRNVPAGFKIALERFRAAEPRELAFGSAAGVSDNEVHVAATAVQTAPEDWTAGEVGASSVNGEPHIEINYVFEGDVYDAESFDRKVAQADNRNKRKSGLRNYGLAGGRA